MSTGEQWARYNKSNSLARYVILHPIVTCILVGIMYGGGAEARVLEGLVTQLARVLVWLQHDENA